MTVLSHPPSEAPAQSPTMMGAREEVRMTEANYGYSPALVDALFRFAGTTDIDEALRIARERQVVGLERMKTHAGELALLADPEFRAAARR